MYTIKDIFRIGYGPSSSHTIAPGKAAEIFEEKNPDAVSYRVTLYGSLGATGIGHKTDLAIQKCMKRPVEIVWKAEESLPSHPNGMLFEAIGKKNNTINSWEVYSVGGGELSDGNVYIGPKNTLYPCSTMTEVLKWCHAEGRSLWEFVEIHEGSEIYTYLDEIWGVMKESIHRGLNNEGVLPGSLKVQRKAASYHTKAKNARGGIEDKGMIFSLALAVAEENAAGGKVVTAPTCGSSGVLPAVLYFAQKNFNLNDTRILRALSIAGIIGNIVKTNGSISGAEVGCQGEIGTACAMAAGAITYIYGGSPSQIEYAAEMAFEHNLGLTCDPIEGYVQIPCIERNAFAADKARQCGVYAIFSDGAHKISFDQVVSTMMETGKDMQSKYRETGKGGLARSWTYFKV